MPRNNSGKRNVVPKRKQKAAEPPTTTNIVLGPPQTVSKVPVDLSLALKLRALDRALYSEFGFGVEQQISYSIRGGGGVLAASNEQDGVVVALAKDEPVEGRVYSPELLWQQPDGTICIHPTLGVGKIQPVGKATDDELDDRVAIFENGERFILPAPANVRNAYPWDAVVKLIRPSGTQTNTDYSPPA